MPLFDGFDDAFEFDDAADMLLLIAPPLRAMSPCLLLMLARYATRHAY